MTWDELIDLARGKLEIELEKLAADADVYETVDLATSVEEIADQLQQLAEIERTKEGDEKVCD